MKQRTVAENVKITQHSIKSKTKDKKLFVSLYSIYKLIQTTFVLLHVRDEELKME
jgi:hypothetical protein